MVVLIEITVSLAIPIRKLGEEEPGSPNRAGRTPRNDARCADLLAGDKSSRLIASCASSASMAVASMNSHSAKRRVTSKESLHFAKLDFPRGYGRMIWSRKRAFDFHVIPVRLSIA